MIVLHAIAGGDLLVAQAPESPATGPAMVVVPHLGLGQIGPTPSHGKYQGLGGIQIEGDLRWIVRPAISLGAWAIPVSCDGFFNEEPASEQCPSKGWFAEAGLNVGPTRRTRVLPFVGAGVGVYDASARKTAVNVRLGMDGGRQHRVGYRIEGRYVQRLEAYNRHVLQATVGVLIRLGAAQPE